MRVDARLERGEIEGDRSLECVDARAMRAMRAMRAPARAKINKNRVKTNKWFRDHLRNGRGCGTVGQWDLIDSHITGHRKSK